MIAQDLDGNDYDWTISNKISRGNKRKTSNLHSIAKSLLRKKYPNTQIYEEVPIDIVIKSKKLFLDFYVPSLSLAIEVNGGQHYKFNPHFHKSKRDFYKACVNDSNKLYWCELNEIELVILKFDEIDKWDSQI